MATSVLFALIDALVTQARAALPNVIVLDNQVTSDPGDYLIVGTDDPDAEGLALAGENQQGWAGLGAQARDESGSIWCIAMAKNGDGVASAARESVQTIVTAVENLCRTNPGLGVLTTGWVSAVTEGRLSQSHVGGATAAFVFQVAYQNARI